MDHHLDGEGGIGNGRNGYGRKTVMTETGKLELEIPRDRQSSFDPLRNSLIVGACFAGWWAPISADGGQARA
jgi:hypothetical protein